MSADFEMRTVAVWSASGSLRSVYSDARILSSNMTAAFLMLATLVSTNTFRNRLSTY